MSMFMMKLYVTIWEPPMTMFWCDSGVEYPVLLNVNVKLAWITPTVLWLFSRTRTWKLTPCVNGLGPEINSTCSITTLDAGCTTNHVEFVKLKERIVSSSLPEYSKLMVKLPIVACCAIEMLNEYTTE